MFILIHNDFKDRNLQIGQVYEDDDEDKMYLDLFSLIDQGFVITVSHSDSKFNVQ